MIEHMVVGWFISTYIVLTGIAGLAIYYLIKER